MNGGKCRDATRLIDFDAALMDEHQLAQEKLFILVASRLPSKGN